ncbi:mechanosensitive ion channel [Candidatus Bathyarchaeota archaeon]|nr:mechanosensitive ion channel [Candidatus Bathyarchaeota archaeon]
MFEIFAEIPYLMTIVWLIIIIIVALTLERIITRQLKRFIKKTEMPPDVGNGLILTARLLILLGAVIALLHLGGVPSDILVSFSALGGAAVGFASNRTLGNIVAGIYLLIARPFRVGDYVRIDSVEGIVKEISINYVKIRTPARTVVSISTQRILDKEVTNYRIMSSETKLYRYGIELNFDHSLPAEKIETALDGVAERYAEVLPRKPTYEMTKLTRLERNYIFYIYVEDPEDLFELQPKILREITEAWEKVKNEAQT